MTGEKSTIRGKELTVKRLLVCGGRDYDDWKTMWDVLAPFVNGVQPYVLVHGDARGADRMAEHIWDCGCWESEAHPADWEKHGKRAGPIRNAEMLATGIDLAIVFPGGRGTDDMRRRLEKAGVKCVVVSDD